MRVTLAVFISNDKLAKTFSSYFTAYTPSSSSQSIGWRWAERKVATYLLKLIWPPMEEAATLGVGAGGVGVADMLVDDG